MSRGTMVSNSNSNLHQTTMKLQELRSPSTVNTTNARVNTMRESTESCCKDEEKLRNLMPSQKAAFLKRKKS